MKTWQIKMLAWAIALPFAAVFWTLYIVLYPVYGLLNWWAKQPITKGGDQDARQENEKEEHYQEEEAVV